jgi:hypothetical protein
VPEFELPQGQQVAMRLQRVAVVKALEMMSTLGVPLILQVALVLEVGLPLALQAVMVSEIDLHLELQVVIWLKQLVVWELAPERTASIPGFEFSRAQKQTVIRPSVP